MREFDPISVLEAGYRRPTNVDGWLTTVASAVQSPLAPGQNMFAYRLDVETWNIESLICTDPSLLDTFRQLVTAGVHDPARREDVAQVDPMGLFTSSEVFSSYETVGDAADFFSLAFHDGEHRLHVVNAPTDVVSTIPDDVRPVWRRVALHLSAAARLLVHPGEIDDEQVEAVMTPDGQILHAEPEARGRSEQEALREFAKRVDRARTKRVRADPEEALDLWTGLLLGRWTLVDHFDTDGRRFIIARKNDPDSPVPGALTRRERQVAFFTGIGLGNKQIAYGLGLSESTVASHLQRVLTKLRLDSRERLIEVAAKSAQR